MCDCDKAEELFAHMVTENEMNTLAGDLMTIS